MGIGPAPLLFYYPAQKHVQRQNQPITKKNQLQTLITRKYIALVATHEPFHPVR